MNRKLAATYFIGYPVTLVTGAKDGFVIQFPQGQIESHDGSTSQPTQVSGLTLTSVIYPIDHGSTTLVFTGGVEVALDPSLYSVTHPSCGTIFPEQDDPEPSPLPPDPSPERVADGPVMES